ncbi:hypothetical protein AMATHDRAFT_8653 [Amanita thiersii Skay4041]|uniref:Uncharacterized protein n=1 Tax=Amanita thiersii Skay4041 TaxID=703135 RepID=A0A2A9NC09_9AGAR|nr:hypothetical protein AMATHDRAFT_8653 [Amanita thiersii Skay4041]
MHTLSADSPNASKVEKARETSIYPKRQLSFITKGRCTSTFPSPPPVLQAKIQRHSQVVVPILQNAGNDNKNTCIPNNLGAKQHTPNQLCLFIVGFYQRGCYVRLDHCVKTDMMLPVMDILSKVSEMILHLQVRVVVKVSIKIGFRVEWAQRVMPSILKVLLYIRSFILNLFRNATACTKMYDEENQTHSPAAGTSTVTITTTHIPKPRYPSLQGSFTFLFTCLYLNSTQDFKRNRYGSHLRQQAPNQTTATDVNDPNYKTDQKPTNKRRVYSTKYLLRHGGTYVDNWNSPGCDLSDLYRGNGKRKGSSSLSPSPLLYSVNPPPASQSQPFRFSSLSPVLPTTTPPLLQGQSQSTRSSPFLSPVLQTQSPSLQTDITGLTQSILATFKPISYTNQSALSAVTSDFWDSPTSIVESSLFKVRERGGTLGSATVSSLTATICERPQEYSTGEYKIFSASPDTGLEPAAAFTVSSPPEYPFSFGLLGSSSGTVSGYEGTSLRERASILAINGEYSKTHSSQIVVSVSGFVNA